MTISDSIKNVLRPSYIRLQQSRAGRSLRLSRFAFERKRSRYFAAHPVFKDHSDLADVTLRDFLDNGVVVLKEYFPRDYIAGLRREALEVARRTAAGEAPECWSTYAYPDDGIYRIRNIDEVLPAASRVIDDAYLNQLARGYLGFPIRGRGNYLDYKPDIGKHDDTTVPHMDSWISQVKIFTLLSDVTPLTAPLVYWKRSHLDWPWRRDFDFRFFQETSTGTAGVCPPSLLRSQSGEAAELEKFTVVAPAGSVVLADTRGFHRASNLFADYRLEIVQKFTVVMI